MAIKHLRNVFFLLTFILFNSSLVFGNNISLSESTIQQEDVVCDCNNITCDNIMSNITVNVDIEEENGASFEYSSENGQKYTIDNNECLVTFSGRCTGAAKETITVTSTVTVTATPTPTPSFSNDEAPACEFYKGSINAYNLIRGEVWSIIDKEDSPLADLTSDSYKGNIVSENNTGLSCIDEKLNTIISGCDKIKTDYKDDCMAIGITNYFFKGIKYNNYNEDDSSYYHKLVNNSTSTTGTCIATDFDSHTSYNSTDTVCLDGYFYFDKDCTPISETDVISSCGDIDVSFKNNFMWSTPISLIWSDDHDLNKDLVVAKFNLDLNNTNKAWFVWKASSEAPLLVYDPNKSGIITDASQLFGNWTFGGKRIASLINTNLKQLAGKWENGFEPLSLFDRDFNEKLTGDELKDLALWFDNNRDGISQKGEVKPLKELGIKTLYFNGYALDANGDLRLELGYEREVDGVIKTGAMIDWKEIGASLKTDLVELLQKNNIEKSSNINLTDKNSKDQRQSKITKRELWKWYIDENMASELGMSNGTFAFEFDENNNFKGYSFTEKLFKKSPNQNLNSFVSLKALKGEKQNDTLYFSIQSGNSYINSKGILSSDGNTLEGESSVLLAGNKKVTYRWIAKKK